MPSEGPEPESIQPEPPADDPGLETILDRYMDELAAGRTPDQDGYLKAHPEHADALRGVFRTLEFVEATGRSLQATQLERGQQLGEFRILRPLARGGMGIVYEALQTSLNRRVALKVLPAGALLVGHGAERFAREAAMAGRLHHTNIVPVYATGEAQGIHYYAMQFIEGQSLAEHLKRLREANTRPGHDYFRRVARWGQQVADALAYAHEQGIIHRDIKPSNLLLDARDNVWITDFGLARATAQATITLSGDVIGTARYMSPEQARGGRAQIDGRTDIYSLGVTLYELLTLSPAFDGESRAEVLNRIVFADPPPVRQVNHAIPRDLETIVGKCMEKEAERRFQRAADVADDCRRFVAGESIHARRTPAVVKVARFLRRHPVHAAGTAITAVLVLVALALALNIRHMHGERRIEEAFDALLFEEDYGRAGRLLDEAAALGANSAELYLYRGLIPLLDNQPQRAMGDLSHALQLAPDSPEVNLALALAYNANADFVNGQRLLDRVPEERITTALGWQLRGLALSKTHRSEAVEAFDKAIAIRADFTPAIGTRAHYRGVRLVTEGLRDELQPMLDDCDALVVFRPHSARSYAARAEGWLCAAAYARTQPDLREYVDKWLASGREDVERALELRRADDSLPFVRQGVYARYVGDWRGAADAFAAAIAVDVAAGREPHPYRVHERAIALHALGELEPALREIEPACAAAPTYCPLHLQRALLLAEMGRVNEARAVCRQSLTQQAANLGGLVLVAAVLDLVGDSETPAAILQQQLSRADEEAALQEGGLPVRRPALEYLAGRVSADDLLASAAGDPSDRCEFAFLIGLHLLARGDRAGGLAALRTCVDTGVYIFGEYRLAQLLLARANADPEWPRWKHAAPTSAPVQR